MRTKRKVDPSARAHAIARGIVETYLTGLFGPSELKRNFGTDEEKLATRIAHAIERAAGGR